MTNSSEHLGYLDSDGNFHNITDLQPCTKIVCPRCHKSVVVKRYAEDDNGQILRTNYESIILRGWKSWFKPYASHTKVYLCPECNELAEGIMSAFNQGKDILWIE